MDEFVGFAVVNVEGSWLVKIRAIFNTKEEALSAKSEYPHPFGTYVYPVGAYQKVGRQMRREPEFEVA